MRLVLNNKRIYEYSKKEKEVIKSWEHINHLSATNCCSARRTTLRTSGLPSCAHYKKMSCVLGTKFVLRNCKKETSPDVCIRVIMMPQLIAGINWKDNIISSKNLLQLNNQPLLTSVR